MTNRLDKLDSKEIGLFAGLSIGLVALLALAFVSNTVTPQSSHATDVSNDLSYNLVNIAGKASTCNYNIIQVVGGTTRNIQEIDCLKQNVLFESTNATLVFQDVFNRVNANGGGRVHVTGYSQNGTLNHPYNITGSIKLPYSGYLDIFGDGAYTVLKIPSTRDNIDMFYTAGTISTHDIYFNSWRDMRLEGNPVGTNNSGFYLNSITHGYHDSVFINLFVENFALDDLFINTYNAWNMQFTDDVFELGGRNGNGYCVEHAGGSDTRFVSNKFLFCHGSYAIKLAGGFNTISSSWFYQNDRSALLLGNQPNVIVANKFFDNGLTASNTYYDIALSSATNTVMNANTFSGSDQTNKTKCAIDIGDSASINNNINANNLTPNAGASYGTAPICGFHSSGVNQMSNNVGWNPRGKITSFIDNSGLYFVSQAGTSSTLVNNTSYTISDSPILLSSSGGSGVSISLLDNNNNVIQSGLTTLTGQLLPVGFKVKVLWSVSAPTFTVYFQ